jgi:hypothetical protein
VFDVLILNRTTECATISSGTTEIIHVLAVDGPLEGESPNVQSVRRF